MGGRRDCPLDTAEHIQINFLNVPNFSFVFQMMIETCECWVESEIICYRYVFIIMTLMAKIFDWEGTGHQLINTSQFYWSNNLHILKYTAFKCVF